MQNIFQVVNNSAGSLGPLFACLRLYTLFQFLLRNLSVYLPFKKYCAHLEPIVLNNWMLRVLKILKLRKLWTISFCFYNFFPKVWGQLFLQWWLKVHYLSADFKGVLNGCLQRAFCHAERRIVTASSLFADLKW
jgi:hypothetical protein